MSEAERKRGATRKEGAAAGVPSKRQAIDVRGELRPTSSAPKVLQIDGGAQVGDHLIRMNTSAHWSAAFVPICIVVMLMPASPRMVPITPMRPGASVASNTKRVLRRRDVDLVPEQRHQTRHLLYHAVRVDATSTPSATTRTVEAARASGWAVVSILMPWRDATESTFAVVTELTRRYEKRPVERGGDEHGGIGSRDGTRKLHTHLGRDAAENLSRHAAHHLARGGTNGPSTSSTSGDTGDTLIAVGTMDPSKPAQTYFAICVPARTCASRVSAAICGVRTAASSSCKVEDVHGSSS